MTSHLPEDFKTRILQQLGASAVDFIKALNSLPPVSIRLNPDKIAHSATRLTQVPWCAAGYFLDERPNFTTDPWFQSGAYYVQESGSMFIHHILAQIYGKTPPKTVLDLCGAPGGKTTLAASFLPQDTLIVANETVKSRAGILVENIDKWGSDNVVVTSNDPKHFARLNSFFDLCLIDAPCSGEGLFRKDPAAINQWTPSAAKLCVGRQRRILTDVWDAINEGGTVIYSTCTYNPEENEENLHWLASKCDIEFIDIKTPQQWNIDTVEYNGVKGYRFFPHKTRSEGFFAAAFRKLSANKTSINKLKTKQNINSTPKKFRNEILRYCKTANTFVFNNFIINNPVEHKLINILGSELNVIRGGCKIATIIKESLKPEHTASLSHNLNTSAWETIPLNTEQANKYYRKENITLLNTNKGWHVALWNGLPIGFINQLGNRTNTTLPTEHRILKTFNHSNINVLGDEFKAI